MQKMHCLVFPIGYFFLVLLPTCLSMTNANNITTDQYALLAFKNHITSDTHQFLSKNWSVSVSVCEWIGVTCGSRHHRVTVLNVSYMGLSGTIPLQLGNLSFLISLDITGNNFQGGLPNELSHLRRLKVLNLNVNGLSGEIPPWIGSLHELQFLYMGNNTFTGSIPSSISNLSKLELLHLSFNSLEGSIPKGIGSLHNLKKFVIEYNQITGLIPLELFNISSLERIALMSNNLSGSLPMSICNRLRKLNWLNLSINKLNGQIPSDLSQCSHLQVLGLSFNEFGGFIPKEIGNLRLLEQLYLGGSNLDGKIPREFGNLTKLKTLSIRECNVSGAVPVEVFNLSTLSLLALPFNKLSGNLPSHVCSDLPNLEGLYLNTNNLHGALPESISNCSKLQRIELAYNEFAGTIPNSLGNLRLLQWLGLSNNYFTSSFPSLQHGFINFLSNCKHLRYFAVSVNPLSGQLPESVGNLSTTLERFYAHNCDIKGNIPRGFGNLSGLILLSLYGNQLIGSIPETIKDLQQLQGLDLGNNKLNRAPLNKLCGLPKLEGLCLRRNQILEPIPECLGNLSSLRELGLDSNLLHSTIPQNLFDLRYLLKLDLSENSLSGILPSEIGNLKVATLLDLSVNNLSSAIPSTIGGLQDLAYLSLAFNGFQGPIPESLGSMLSLETLNLSHNHLSGSTPMSLEKLKYLKYFNVSFNNLSGQIPSGGPFENFTRESFISNEGLCGPQRFHVPPCPTMSNKKPKTKSLVRTILICIGTATALILLAFGLVYLRYRKKIIGLGGNDLSIPGGHERFSYYELLKATERYNETNLLGIGGFGSVYHGTLRDGRIVAIKVFNSQFERALRSFDAECQVLRNLRHRNLAKVISSCSTPDFKALVLEFMPNGSLDKQLHSDNFTLDLKKRLNIMLDVATALQYLHGGYSTQVVHCDLKPSNILLDQEMVAHVSDFGIAKMMNQEDSFTHTATIATLGYLAPEYGLEGLVSTKCDVYSYGIMLMEVFTKIRPSDERFDGNFSLKDMVQKCIPDSLHQVVDASLFQDGEEHKAEKLECIYSIMEIALTCTRESARERSTMDQVVSALNKINTKFMS